MTNQEIFNTIYLGLESQGFKRSRDEMRGYCMFRGDNGMKCAAGWLIPDEEYDEDFENQGMVVQNDWFINHFGDAYGDTIWLIRDLQKIHDGSKTPDEMKEGLTRFAKHSNLTVPV